MRETRPYWIHALSPIHVGAGRGIDFIDLPIVREVVTNWPYVPGSGVKGVLADEHGADDAGREGDPTLATAFGRAGDDLANAGSLMFTDARLVCLPVRSFYGTFAWCTSPLALARVARDVDPLGEPPELELPAAPSEVLVPPVPVSKLAQGSRAFFEDLDFDVRSHATVQTWAERIADALFPSVGSPAWRAVFLERFVVVHEDVFSFLCDTATQVDARVRIDDDLKTVAHGQLWYEEALPAESILAGLAWCGDVFGAGEANNAERRTALLNAYCAGEHLLQIGGKATVGRGQVRLRFVTPQEAVAGAEA